MNVWLLFGEVEFDFLVKKRKLLLELGFSLLMSSLSLWIEYLKKMGGLTWKFLGS